MRVIDPGHTYALGVLDGDTAMVLEFVKREGPLYPGNVGTQCGTTLQEVLRACLDRIEYLDQQIPDENNAIVRFNLRSSIIALERRAAQRHSRQMPDDPIYGALCQHCLHVGCDSCLAQDAQKEER